MKHIIETFLRIFLFAIILTIWWLVMNASFSNVVNFSIIVGGVLLTFPLVWFGRKILDQHQTIGHAVWTTTFVFEERELEFRFGASYLEYKSKTPMLFPRKPSVH